MPLGLCKDRDVLQTITAGLRLRRVNFLTEAGLLRAEGALGE